MDSGLWKRLDGDISHDSSRNWVQSGPWSPPLLSLEGIMDPLIFLLSWIIVIVQIIFKYGLGRGIHRGVSVIYYPNRGA